MNADSTRAAKVWVWDGALCEADGQLRQERRRGAMQPVANDVDERDAVIVANGRLPCRTGADIASGSNEREGACGSAGQMQLTRKAVSSANVWQLLAPGADDSLRDSAEIFRRWKRAGMLRGGEEGGSQTLREKAGSAIVDGWRVYVVSVLHLEPVSVQRVRSSELPDTSRFGTAVSSTCSSPAGGMFSKGGDLFSPIGGTQLTVLLGSDSLLRRVARMAVRAVYTSGLDVGDAVVALHGSGRTAALGVGQPVHWAQKEGAAAASWDEALLRFRVWYGAERDHAEAAAKPLLIGADPEFILLRDDGRIAPADRYFGVGGGAGADALVVGRKIQYPIGEVRPDPAHSPEGLAANVRRQLKRAASRVNDDSLRWAAGAMPVAGVALGGHIHVSGVPLTSRLLRQLDRYVALPVAMVESDNGRGRRPRYGVLGDYRMQPHGGFEYRTLPSWLVSPLTAKAAFALTLLCAKDTWELPCQPLLAERDEAAFYEGDRPELSVSLDAIANELAASPSYAEYARWIEPLFEAARRGAVWDESIDIRRKWRVGGSE